MASFKAGAQVEAPAEGAVGSWYSGVVKSVKRDGTARVLFDESEEIAEVPVASCRPLPPEAAPSGWLEALKEGGPLEVRHNDGWWSARLAARKGTASSRRAQLKLVVGPGRGCAQQTPTMQLALPESLAVEPQSVRPAWAWHAGEWRMAHEAPELLGVASGLPLSEAAAAAPEGKELVGKLVEVKWDGKGEWYEAKVLRYDAKSARHAVRYTDDGVEQPEDLARLWYGRSWRLKKAAPPPSSSAAAADCLLYTSPSPRD